MSNIKYYCSGWDKEIGFNKEFIDSLKKDIKKLDKLVFIPSDFNNKEKITKNTNVFSQMFYNAGFPFEKISILNENMSKEIMYNEIMSSDVVFLMGGNPNPQLEIINHFDLEEAIRKTDAVIIGLSAGAMCMSTYSMLLPVSEKYPILDIRKGMNLSGINIYPHYNSNGEFPEVLTVDTESTKKEDLLYAISNYGPVYLLSDNSEIREENNNLSFIGSDIIYLNKDGFKFMPKEDLRTK
jgi:peptidase E